MVDAICALVDRAQHLRGPGKCRAVAALLAVADPAGCVWDVSLPAARVVLWALFWLGWATVFFSSFMVSHFDLFGLRQVFLAWRGKPYRDLNFRVRFLYRLVRHPLMLGS